MECLLSTFTQSTQNLFSLKFLTANKTETKEQKYFVGIIFDLWGHFPLENNQIRISRFTKFFWKAVKVRSDFIYPGTKNCFMKFMSFRGMLWPFDLSLFLITRSRGSTWKQHNKKLNNFSNRKTKTENHRMNSSHAESRIKARRAFLCVKMLIDFLLTANRKLFMTLLGQIREYKNWTVINFLWSL